MMLPGKIKILCSKAVAARPMHDVMLKQDCECEHILAKSLFAPKFVGCTHDAGLSRTGLRRGSVQEISTAHWPADEA